MGSQRYSQQDLMNFDWDDTELIAAYDKAKAKAAAKMKQAKNKSSEKPTSEDKQWEVGSHCRALYSEDGYYYEAKVIELDDDGNCTVEFLGYEEFEEVDVKTLKPSKGKCARKNQIKNVLETSEQMSLTCGETSEAETASVASSIPKVRRQKTPSAENVPPMKPPLPMPRMQPYMAPPPLPPMPQGPSIANDPAMCAMLRSWYMAGYYFGLYEQQNQRGTSCCAPCCCGHSNQYY